MNKKRFLTYLGEEEERLISAKYRAKLPNELASYDGSLLTIEKIREHVNKLRDD